MADLTKGDIAEAAVRTALRAVQEIAGGTRRPIYSGKTWNCERRLAARDVVRKLEETLDVLAELPGPSEELKRVTARAERAETIVHTVLREAQPPAAADFDVRKDFALAVTFGPGFVSQAFGRGLRPVPDEWKERAVNPLALDRKVIKLDVSDRCPPNYRTPTQIRALCTYAGEPSPGASIPAPVGVKPFVAADGYSTDEGTPP